MSLLRRIENLERYKPPFQLVFANPENPISDEALKKKLAKSDDIRVICWTDGRWEAKRIEDRIELFKN